MKDLIRMLVDISHMDLNGQETYEKIYKNTVSELEGSIAADAVSYFEKKPLEKDDDYRLGKDDPEYIKTLANDLNNRFIEEAAEKMECLEAKKESSWQDLIQAATEGDTQIQEDLHGLLNALVGMSDGFTMENCYGILCYEESSYAFHSSMSKAIYDDVMDHPEKYASVTIWVEK